MKGKYTEADLAYIAGIIDGEGYIGLNKTFTADGRPGYNLCLVIANTDARLAHWLVGHIGGRIIIDEKKRSSVWKPCYCWNLCGMEASNLLRFVQPFSVIKSEQIDLALQFATLGFYNHGGVPTNVMEQRDVLTDAMHILNQKGRR